MKFIEPSVKYLSQEPTLDGAWSIIAKAARVCYQSEARKNESDEDFVKRVILKPALIEGDLNDLAACKFNIDKLHGGVLEHGTVYLTIPALDVVFSDEAYHTVNFYDKNPYSVSIHPSKQDIKYYYITTNIRVILENNRWNDLKWLSNPTNHLMRRTFSVITDIGVTREFNRHRASMSICEESTRYCDYSKTNKFGEDLTFIKPQWLNTKKDIECLSKSYISAEKSYKELRKYGWKPEEARQVLPLGLKTQAIYTATENAWQHFIRLRADNVSGKAHPNINYIANLIKELLIDINDIEYLEKTTK